MEEIITTTSRNRTKQKLTGMVHILYMDPHIHLGSVKLLRRRKKTSKVRIKSVILIIIIINGTIVVGSSKATKTVHREIIISKKLKKIRIIPKRTKICKTYTMKIS